MSESDLQADKPSVCAEFPPAQDELVLLEADLHVHGSLEVVAGSGAVRAHYATHDVGVRRDVLVARRSDGELQIRGDRRVMVGLNGESERSSKGSPPSAIKQN